MPRTDPRFPKSRWDDRLLEVLAPEHIFSIPALWRYMLALVIVAAATAIRVAMIPWIGTIVPYNVYVIAACGATVFLGFGPALVFVVLGIAAVEVFVLGSLPVMFAAETLHRMGFAAVMGFTVSAALHAARIAAVKARKNERRLAAFGKATFEGVVESESGIVVDCNEQFAQMLGLTVDEVKGRAIADWIAPEDREHVLANIRENRESAIEHRMLRPDGTQMYVEAHGRELYPGSARRYTAVRDVTRQKRAEAEMERMQNLMTEGQKITHLGTFEYVAETQTTVWSEEEYRIYGLDPTGPSPSYEVMLAKSIHPEDSALLDETFKAAMQSCSVYELEHRIVQPDGSIRWVYDRAHPYFDQNGKLVRYVGATLDITERKQVEKALRESEERFRTLADNIPQLCWMANSDGWIFWYNKRWYEYTGTTPQQMAGWGWKAVHDPEALAHVLERWQSSIATGKPLDMTFPLRGADGSFRPFLTRVMPVFADDGKLVRWFGTNTDITDQKRAEEALLVSVQCERDRAGELAALLDAVPMPLFIAHDRDCRHITGNCAADELLKNPRGGEASLGASIDMRPQHFRAFKEGRELAVEELPAQRAARGERVEGMEFSLVFDDGTVCEVIGYAMPLHNADGQPRGSILAMADITERKQTERKILRLSEDMVARNAELQAVNKELESFIYSIAHDLRGPARHMNGFAEILLENYPDRLDEQGKDYLIRIRNGSRKMARLIDDLLHLSQVSRQAIISETVDLSALAHSVTASLREADPNRKITVSITEGATARADRGLMEVVLSNLLGNAWKFTAKTEDACIEFGVMREGTGNDSLEGAVYFIRDNGVGFNAEYKDKMFMPFHRLHSEKEFEGTGIGLAIVERIIHRHRGKIWAEGEVGKGATIYFTLK